MIIDKNGRLFGKISIVDIFVILIALIVAFGVYFRFSGNIGKASVDSQEFYYTIEIKNVRRPTYDGVMKTKGSTFYSCDKSEANMGILIEAEASQSMIYFEKADGTAAVADVPENYDLKLTFKVDGNVNKDGYFTQNKSQINAGSGYTIKSKYSTIFGVVTKVWTE